jgi:translation initiation factor IF-1
MVSNSKAFKIEGLVIEALPGLLFRVKLEGEREVLAYLGGKMKLNRIRVIPGDRVLIEMPDLNDRRGRIVRRL